MAFHLNEIKEITMYKVNYNIICTIYIFTTIKGYDFIYMI